MTTATVTSWMQQMTPNNDNGNRYIMDAANTPNNDNGIFTSWMQQIHQMTTATVTSWMQQIHQMMTTATDTSWMQYINDNGNRFWMQQIIMTTATVTSCLQQIHQIMTTATDTSMDAALHQIMKTVNLDIFLAANTPNNVCGNSYFGSSKYTK